VVKVTDGLRAIIEKAGGGRERSKGVSFDRLWTIGFAIAALVGRDRAKASVSERADLMAPRVPELGKAVAQHDWETTAGLDHMHPDAVGIDERVIEYGH
jgi:hypothetical protein